MPAPEQLPDSGTPRPKKPLYIRMYFQQAYVDLVRFLGYGGRTMDEVQPFVCYLDKTHGAAKAREAVDAVAQIEERGASRIMRLTTEARKLAWQMLGQPPETPAASSPLPLNDPLPFPETAKQPRGRKGSPASNDGPLRQPRNYVLQRFQEWLQKNSQCFIDASMLRQTMPSLRKHAAVLDFLVLRGEEKLLVTLRPHLQAKQIAALREIQKLFGMEYQAIRIWPSDGQTGWSWEEFAIDLS